MELNSETQPLNHKREHRTADQIYPQPQTHNPKPQTINPQPPTSDPQP